MWQSILWNRIGLVCFTSCPLSPPHLRLKRKHVDLGKVRLSYPLKLEYEDVDDGDDSKEEWLVTQCSALIGLLTLLLTAGGES